MFISNKHFLHAMESKIKSSYEIKTYFPNEEEFGDFGSYIKKISELSNNDCFAKIVPPHSIESRDIRRNVQLKMVIAQSVTNRAVDESGQILGYHLSFEDQFTMKYGEYRDTALKTDAKYAHLNIAQHEDRFWEEISQRTDQTSEAPLYAIDNNIPLFSRNQKNCWDLSKLTESDSLIHQSDIECIPGVHTPYTYVGNKGTSFCFHTEDSDLCSINFHHGGKPKFWYGSPDTERKKLQHLVQKIAKRLNINCSQYVRHKRIMIPPSVLQKHNILFTRIIQNEGEFVISFSGGFHQGFNIGLNLNSAVNFGDYRWLKFYSRFELCNCEYSEIPRKIHQLLAPLVKKFENLSLQPNDVFESSSVDLPLKEAEPLPPIQARPKQPIIKSITKNVEKKFQCNVCPCAFVYKRGLTEHIRDKHEQFISRYECFICAKTFVNKTLWVKHLKDAHKTVVNLKTANDHVQKLRNTKSLAEERVRKMKKTVRPKLICDLIVDGVVCGIVTHGVANMKRHKRNKHSPLK